MCKCCPNRYVGFLTASELKKEYTAIVKAELELRQAQSSLSPDKNLIFQLTEYLEYLQGRVCT
jgi:hypothetical protein